MYYIYKELEKQETLSFTDKFNLRCQYLYYKLNFFLYDVYFIVSSFFSDSSGSGNGSKKSANEPDGMISEMERMREGIDNSKNQKI